MIKKTLFILGLIVIFLHPQFIQAQEEKKIEIFDPDKEKVVKVVESNEEINSMVKSWINGIDETYKKVNPIKDDGYAIRFPLNPSIEVKNKWLNKSVKEVYLIVPQKDPAFFIIFGQENKPLYFPFDGKISDLSNILDFKLK
ncbi:MAG: hypothetical protein ACTHW2_04525 [Tissierella sp.]|uniref:hypothetical protein n=1 Tax=Tissierella sp. TaxID=41274 RepID=UPI003F9C09F3